MKTDVTDKKSFIFKLLSHKNNFSNLILLFSLGFAFLFGILFYKSGIPSKWHSEIKVYLLSEGESVSKVSILATEVKSNIENEIKLYDTNGLSTLFLDIPFESLLSLEDKRNEALNAGILLSSDEDYVPATMRFMNNDSIDIDIRLKGDWVDHLQGEKWSYRIHIDDDNSSIYGMRKFSLQDPSTRNFLFEWGYHQNLISEDILTTRYHFINVILNGDYKGVYALEESFTDNLLESQNRRAGLIIRLDEDYLWRNWARFINAEHDLYILGASKRVGLFTEAEGDNNPIIKPFEMNKLLTDEILNDQLIAAENLLNSLNINRGTLKPNQVLDEELWGKFYAITDLWAAGHSTRWHNLRFYYNPITGLLEPIAFDGGPMGAFFKRDEIAYPFSSYEIFTAPGIQKSYIKTLERITSKSYSDQLKDLLNPEYQQFLNILEKEYGKETAFLRLPWDDLEFRQDVLFRNLNPDLSIRGNYSVTDIHDTQYLKIDLTNQMVVPVQINDLYFGDTKLSFENNWCLDDQCMASLVEKSSGVVIQSGVSLEFLPVSFYVPIEDLPADPMDYEYIEVIVNVNGASEKAIIKIYPGYSPQIIFETDRPNVGLEETLANHEFLMKINDSQLVVAQGDWQVSGDLIIPEGYDFLVFGGTTLRFGTNSIFLSYGKIELLGEEESQIILTAQDDHWGGMVIMNAQEKSKIRYSKIEKMAGIQRGGWIQTGGINFYQSPVDISFTKIGNNQTEDAINIIRSSFTFEYVEVHDTPSDGFDGDFITSGEINNCSFHDIGGDGIDFSGSQIDVTDTRFSNINDKAISVGENSKLFISGVFIKNAGIGIASKDLSHVEVTNTTIDSIKIAGLAAYTKKPVYGPASINAIDTNIINSDVKVLCQINSEINLNGEEIIPQEIDVDKLYYQDDFDNLWAP